MSNLSDSVNEVMQKKPVFAETGTTVSEVATLMDRENVGTVIITSNNVVEGIVTDRDVVTKVVAKGRDPECVGVSEIMTMNPETINQYATCREAVAKMGGWGFRRLPVVDQDNKLVGVISISDLCSMLRSNNDCVEDILCIVSGDAHFSRAKVRAI